MLNQQIFESAPGLWGLHLHESLNHTFCGHGYDQEFGPHRFTIPLGYTNAAIRQLLQESWFLQLPSFWWWSGRGGRNLQELPEPTNLQPWPGISTWHGKNWANRGSGRYVYYRSCEGISLKSIEKLIRSHFFQESTRSSHIGSKARV